MSNPLYPGLQSNLVYGIETSVEESRLVDGARVVVSQHETRRTYESPTAPLGAPAYTTVCDHVTTSCSGQQPYLVSSAAANQSNYPSCVNPTSGFNNTTHTPMSYSFGQPNQLAQTQYSHFSPLFNSTPYSQNAYQPNQSFAPSFINHNTTQFNQPKVDFTSQFPSSISPNTFSFQPNQSFGHIENQICCPCIKELMDQISLNTMGNAFQTSQSAPVNYNLFFVHQNHQTHSNDEPMVTGSGSDDNLESCACLCIQDGGARSTSTSTSDLSVGAKWDPCATSTPSSWPPEAGTQKARRDAEDATPTKSEATPSTPDAADPANKTETEKMIEAQLESDAEAGTTTREIIAAMLNDILPPHENDQAEKSEVSKDNAAKTDVGKKCPHHHPADKDASTACKPHAHTAGSSAEHSHGRHACGCGRANKKVTFAEAVAAAAALTGAGVGTDVTTTMNFVQFEAEMNSWYLELEESERVFINQAEETIRRDAQNFRSRDELSGLAELLAAELSATDQIDRDLENVNGLREEVGAFIGRLENYYDAFHEASPPSARKYIYDLFEAINTQMCEMRDNLGETSDLITERNGPVTEQQDPVRQIMKILGVHVETLNCIDRKANCLRSQIDEISTLFNQFTWQHSS